MAKKLDAWSITDLAFPIVLHQLGVNRFEVRYGQQVTTGLSYARACAEIGRSVMHALACDGRIDNAE
jgi:hypothetical protein